VISATENSNKFQETRFWKEKSVEDTAINMFLLMSMIFILILIKFYIDINDEEPLKTI
jgi:hypothetical protein